MDTIVLLLILYWIYKKFQKKGSAKKPQKRAAKNDAFRNAERIVRIQEELKRHREEKQLTMQEAVTASAFGEGRPQVPFIHMEGESVQEARREYRGSLNADSTEGECICDPELEHERAAYMDPDSVYAGEIGRRSPLNLSPEGIYQGVVMSEILTRPSRRLRRR